MISVIQHERTQLGATNLLKRMQRDNVVTLLISLWLQDGGWPHSSSTSHPPPSWWEAPAQLLAAKLFINKGCLASCWLIKLGCRVWLISRHHCADPLCFCFHHYLLVSYNLLISLLPCVCIWSVATHANRCGISTAIHIGIRQSKWCSVVIEG